MKRTADGKKKLSWLRLNRETLHQLESSLMGRVAGGSICTNGSDCPNSLPCSFEANSLGYTCLC
jgi:hypothetical protein